MKCSVASKAFFCVACVLSFSRLGWAGTIEGQVRRITRVADLSNFVVSVEDIEAASPAPAETMTMDQKGLQFVPHVLAIQAGTTVDFPNSDPVSHNVFSISEIRRFNLGLYTRGAKRSIRFDRPGLVDLLCNVHLEMSGYIVVLKNPYFALTGPDGTFRITSVPAGRHRLRCWHEWIPAQERMVEVPETGSISVNFTL